MAHTPPKNMAVQPSLNRKLYHQQKRELAILNAIIKTVSSSYNLKETLDSALEIILSVSGSSSGWICLLDGRGCSAFVGSKGLFFTDGSCGPTPCLAQCVCGRVHATREVVVIRQLARDCPLGCGDGQTEKISGHVSVPLLIKDRIVGQLNVAFSQDEQADQMDIELLTAIAPQLAVAVENARLWADVQGKEELRSRLLQRVVSAQEEERRRISRELHDELGQELTSLLVRLQLLEKLETRGDTREIIAGLKTTTTGMLSAIHDMALELRPTILDDLGLVPALAQYIKTCPEHLGLQVDYEVVGASTARLPREVETTLYRIIQESLTNVARHSEVDKASVLLKFSERKVGAIIEDNGVGFDLQNFHDSASKAKSLGLFGMEERAALVGGSLTVESTPGVGTNIYIEVPFQVPAEYSAPQA